MSPALELLFRVRRFGKYLRQIVNDLALPLSQWVSGLRRGAERDRTDDLRLAKPALSQLSYSPSVGQGRLELPTSRLSGVRSNHLSYWPVAGPDALGCPKRSRPLKTEPY